jgi:hypothetical protein
MAGYQFIHMETYSRKEDASGRSVEWVLAEARRDPDACHHVSEPQGPELVHGVSLDELESLHSEIAEIRKTTLSSGKTRKIRKDQKTLCTIVASYPTPTSELHCNVGEPESLRRWEAETVAWIQSQFGDDLVTVIRHVDEKYPHLHAYILPKSDPEFRALRLHPGHEAKRLIMDSGSDADDKKALNRLGDRAYRHAMREWQNSYHRDVGISSGLTRLGPGRRRLTRDAWRAEQAQARALKSARAKAQAFIERTKNAGNAHIKNSKAKAKEIEKRSELRASRVQAQILEMEKAAETKLAKAKETESRIHERAKTHRRIGYLLRAFWDGLTTSVLRRRMRSQVAAENDRNLQMASAEKRARLRAESLATKTRDETQSMELIHAATVREVSRLKQRLDAEIGSKSKKLTLNKPHTVPFGGIHGV